MIAEKVMKHSLYGQVEIGTDRPGEVEAVAILLYIFAAIAAIGFLSGNLVSIIPIVVNLLLANGLMKMRPWAKTWTIIRCVWGIVFNLLTFGTLHGPFQDASVQIITFGIFDLVRFVVIILMLTKANVRKPNWN